MGMFVFTSTKAGNASVLLRFIFPAVAVRPSDDAVTEYQHSPAQLSYWDSKTWRFQTPVNLQRVEWYIVCSFQALFPSSAWHSETDGSSVGDTQSYWEENKSIRVLCPLPTACSLDDSSSSFICLEPHLINEFILTFPRMSHHLMLTAAHSAFWFLRQYGCLALLLGYRTAITSNTPWFLSLPSSHLKSRPPLIIPLLHPWFMIDGKQPGRGLIKDIFVDWSFQFQCASVPKATHRLL